jgi:TPP-dependent pyruvate/acetoin dehydrogenase alpha subunit
MLFCSAGHRAVGCLETTEEEPLMPIETPTTIDVEAQLQLLEAMLRIRAFEIAANQLYLSAKMPGLTHLYIGE